MNLSLAENLTSSRQNRFMLDNLTNKSDLQQRMVTGINFSESVLFTR